MFQLYFPQGTVFAFKKLIYNNRFYDIGAIYSWGGTDNSLVGLYSGLINNDSTNTIVSSWEKIKDAVEADMNTTIDEYKNNLT